MIFFKNPSVANWIGYLSGECSNFKTQGQPSAPWMRTEFTVNNPEETLMAICGLGYYEVFINGKKVGDHVLDPIAHVYDKHVRYVVYDISSYLKPGKNAVGVVLGSGWYDSYYDDPWILNMVPWRDLPKMRMEIKKKNGRLICASGPQWKITREGPILRDGLRYGECYDARKELNGWSETGYDDSGWSDARVVRGPGGIEEEQTAVPIRVTDTQVLSNPNSKNVYDLGRNIAGHARIMVRGEAGAKVTLRFTERITAEGELDQRCQVFEGFDNTYWQCDEYILKGSADPEIWEPRFTYHGFQYVGVQIEGNAVLEKIEARIVNTDFESIGEISCGNEMVNTLQMLTRRSYLANFVGIPTDCPHREKNGWTGDAELACETGLMNFDAQESYRQWIAVMRDCQRPDGDLPGIVPTGGWGYNWGNGPAWDSALFVIPWNIYLCTGNAKVLSENYDNMKRYLTFLENNCVNHIVQFGLGDWCSDPASMVDERLTNTAIYYGLLRMFVKIARLNRKSRDAAYFSKAADRVKRAFNKTFYNGDGTYAKGELTAMGAALYFDLTPFTSDKEKVVNALVKAVEACDAAAQFGIIGAKYVPRVLADNGYAVLASKFFTQEKFPGWAYWVAADHTASLRETWNSNSSLNHIMFGDLSAWFFKYPGGFRYSEKKPGYRNLTIQPEIIPDWKNFRAVHRGYVCEWNCLENNQVRVDITVPQKCEAEVILPDGTTHICSPGKETFTCLYQS